MKKVENFLILKLSLLYQLNISSLLYRNSENFKIKNKIQETAQTLKNSSDFVFALHKKLQLFRFHSMLGELQIDEKSPPRWTNFHSLSCFKKHYLTNKPEIFVQGLQFFRSLK